MSIKLGTYLWNKSLDCNSYGFFVSLLRQRFKRVAGSNDRFKTYKIIGEIYLLT